MEFISLQHLPVGRPVGTRVGKVVFATPGYSIHRERERGGGSRGPVDFISLPAFPIEPSKNEGGWMMIARGG